MVSDMVYHHIITMVSDMFYQVNEKYPMIDPVHSFLQTTDKGQSNGQ